MKNIFYSFRKNSKRFKKYNKPLIQHTIDFAKNPKTHIVISTDDLKVVPIINVY